MTFARFVTHSSRVLGVFVVGVSLAACASDDQGEASGSGGVTGGSLTGLPTTGGTDTTGTGGTVTASSGSGGMSSGSGSTDSQGSTSATTTAGSATDSSGSATGVRFDVGASATDTVGTGGDTIADDPCEQAAMGQSNQGCLFWAVDLPNAWAGINGSPSPADQQFAVAVANTAADMPATVSVFSGTSTTAIETQSVGVNQIYTFRLPAQSIEPRANSYSGTAYRIESDLPITAYQFNPLDNTVQVFSNDASLLFPVPVLGTDYITVSGDSIQLATDQQPTGDNSGAFISVVATEDGTTVDLFPTWSTFYAGQLNNVALSRGQVFTAISRGNVPSTGPGNGNISGSRVVANKPVAVFSGNVATIEPQPGISGQQCCADHMEHQMLPLTAQGTGYAAIHAPAPSGGGSNKVTYRIVGGFDGTQLTYSPIAPAGAPTVINAGQSVRFETTAPFAVSSTDPGKSFTVAMFLMSNQNIAGPSGQPGDPAMIALPAAAQYQTNYVFLTPDGYQSNFVTIVAPTGAAITLDGAAVGGFNVLGDLAGLQYQWVHVPVGPGSHRVEGDQPFGIVSTGYARDVSYGYPGGSGVAAISVPPPPPG
jgi:hypothetical protein